MQPGETTKPEGVSVADKIQKEAYTNEAYRGMQKAKKVMTVTGFTLVCSLLTPTAASRQARSGCGVRSRC